jgi:benzoate membrane transport protein
MPLLHFKRLSTVPRFREIRRDFGISYILHGLIAALVVATGPATLIFTVGIHAGLTEAQLSSWLFGVFCINGIITIIMSWLYRQPIAFFWSVPGTVLVGPALGHFTFPQVMGTFYASGLVIFFLGWTGWVKPLMQMIPIPIVMAMVAAIFLRFGIDLVHAVPTDIMLASPMILVWLILSIHRRFGEYVPPIIGALVTGCFAAVLLGRFHPTSAASLLLTRPLWQPPVWSWSALVALVVPLVISVLVMSNSQGFAVLHAAGHEPPVDAITLTSGVGSVIAASVGAVSTCLAGPPCAILTMVGERSRQYTGAITVGLLAVAFGLLAPSFTRFMFAAPQAFVAVLAGLAMLRVLQSAFVGAFKGKFTLGSLVTFLVSSSSLNILNIGAAFWGLLAGIAVSWLLERSDFKSGLHP